jgi:hypothetical protein
MNRTYRYGEWYRDPFAARRAAHDGRQTDAHVVPQVFAQNVPSTEVLEPFVVFGQHVITLFVRRHLHHIVIKILHNP